jgi:Carboxypeptidase regulatory-like domain
MSMTHHSFDPSGVRVPHSRELSAMKRQTDVLNLRVASPCHVGWEVMSGDDRVRFCDSCKLNVYDLGGLTTTEIKSLISETEGGICGRLHRRADGTIITRDCPVGLQAVRRRVKRLAVGVFATIVSACSVVFSQSAKRYQTQPFQQLKLERDKLNQAQIGTFSGLIVDTNGASVPFAKVSLRSPASNKTLIVYTDDKGVFTFSDVKDGRYTLKVSAPGFMTFAADFVEINADEFASTKITLSASTKITLSVSGPESPVYITTGFVMSEPEIKLLQPKNIWKLPIDNVISEPEIKLLQPKKHLETPNR